jgi:putative ABC transport system ATP-binding protein
MQQALAIGNRLIMMHQGKIILDTYGADRDKLTVEDLLNEFSKVRGTLTDKTMLSLHNNAP